MKKPQVSAVLTRGGGFTSCSETPMYCRLQPFPDHLKPGSLPFHLLSLTLHQQAQQLCKLIWWEDLGAVPCLKGPRRKGRGAALPTRRFPHPSAPHRRRSPEPHAPSLPSPESLRQAARVRTWVCFHNKAWQTRYESRKISPRESLCSLGKQLIKRPKKK